MGKNKEDSRYPYTYACDFIRSLAGYNEKGIKLSRSDASTIRQGIAFAIGMEDKKLAELLADAEKSKSAEDIQNDVTEYLKHMKGVIL